MTAKHTLLLLTLFCSLMMQAQIGMPDDEQYAHIKTRTLYVEMADTASPFNRKMAEALRYAWTATPLEFVTPTQLTSRLQPGNFFMTLEHDDQSFAFMRQGPNGSFSRSPTIGRDYFYLHFWVLDKNFEAGKDLKQKHKTSVARAELYLQSIGTGSVNFNSKNIGSAFFQFEFCNGLPGYIKCIFQAVSKNISTGKTVQLKKDVDAQPALANLRRDTLYVPNYWYGPGGTMLPNEPENSANGKYIRKLLESYDYPVRLIRRDELSDMLLTASKPLYYFNYVQSSGDKMISVVDGQSGDVLYYNFNDVSYRPKPKNFKELSEVVEKAN